MTNKTVCAPDEEGNTLLSSFHLALHVWHWCKCLMNILTQNIYVLSLYQADEIK